MNIVKAFFNNHSNPVVSKSRNQQEREDLILAFQLQFEEIDAYTEHLKTLDDTNPLKQKEVVRVEEFTKEVGIYLETVSIIDELSEEELKFQSHYEKAEKNISALVASPPLIGGIRNGGNTCYIASALQVADAVPEYRDALDPSKNPLRQKENEEDSQFGLRKEMQQRGFDIITKVSAGTKVDQREINLFRSAFLGYQEEAGIKPLASAQGTGSGPELLEKLLEYIDNKPEVFKMKVLHKAIDEEVEDVDPDSVREDPSKYSTLQELQRGIARDEEVTFTLNPPFNEEPTASMQTMLQEFWKSDNREMIVSDGPRRYINKRFESSRNLNKVNEGSTPPKVLRVLVAQLDNEEKTITDAENFYPSGQWGVGPRYKLRAVIEHRPGHYVGYRYDTAGRFIEANDSITRVKDSNRIPGEAYYYVLDNL